MPIVNKNTTQTPLSRVGRTGAQSIKWIPAPRVYVAQPDVLMGTTIPSVPSKGTTPAGFTDLGIVDGLAPIIFTMQANPISCGLDNKLRMVVRQSVTATTQFKLSQLDDIVLQTISGTPPAYTTANSATYLLGQKPLHQMALLLVCQNKFDGKEWQYYNPGAFLNFDFSADSGGLQVTGYLPWFTADGQTQEAAFAASLFANQVIVGTGYGLSPFGTSAFGL
jgi:hypothetical protein